MGVSNETATAFVFDLSWDDANWILTASFIIFTMQTGFGMLESGCVSVKNEGNIMMKNVVDVVFGGFTYWAFGFALSFGNDPPYSTPFLGFGEFAVDAPVSVMGPVFASFMFQLSFATTATTIVSGTMAERCNFKSYCLFSMFNTVVYCIPARWIWGPTGFLHDMGVIDIAGSGAVHLLGGVSGYVAAWMLGPRLGRYDRGTDPLPLGNPTSCIVGLYILWWGWLAFNSGSTFGVSGVKWKFAARAATSTVIASFGGGLIGSVWTLAKPGRIFSVMDIVNPILGALVAVTAGCALFHTYDAFLVGIIGGATVLLTSGFADWTRVDDPVGATPVHAFGGFMGLVCVALFAEDDRGAGFSNGRAGLFRGGGTYLMKVQLFASLCISIWAAGITFTLLWVTNRIIPIRMEPHEELLGADFVEHLVRRRNAGISTALSVLGSHPEVTQFMKESQPVGHSNPVHDGLLKTMENLNIRRWSRIRNAALVMNAFKSNRKEKENEAKITPTNRIPIPTLTVTSPGEFNYIDYLGNPWITHPNNISDNGHSGHPNLYYTNETKTQNATKPKRRQK